MAVSASNPTKLGVNEPMEKSEIIQRIAELDQIIEDYINKMKNRIKIDESDFNERIGERFCLREELARMN